MSKFDTTGTLTGKVFKTLTADNHKLGDLGNQLDRMEKDFEDMKRAREEAKRKLEEKFTEVYSEIQKTKDQVLEHGKSINRKIKQFQVDFDNKVAEVTKLSEDKHNAFITEMDVGFNKCDERAQVIDQMIIDEREDRIKQMKDELAPINKDLEDIEKSIGIEKTDRIAVEKQIAKKIKEEVIRINKSIVNEKTQRDARIAEVSKDLDHDYSQTIELTERFYGKTKDELVFITESLEKEMDNRFDHQDKAVDNLCNTVNTFQATLKLLGSGA